MPALFTLVTILACVTADQGARTASVRTAEAALVEALQKHDRPAFEQLVAADAVFYLPVLLKGRDEIVKTWLPFLIDAGVTLVLTPETLTAAGSDDLAYTQGTFAFSGNSNRGPGTFTAGSYLAVWRHEGDAWTLRAFAGAGTPPPRPPTTLAGGGFGDYKFGMTRAQVQQVPACQPYMQVPATSGLECPNFTFDGRKMNVSFIFSGEPLTRVQLWYYEGNSEKDARAATDALLDYLRKTYSTIHSYELPQNAEPTTDAIFKVLHEAKIGPNEAARVQIQTAGASPATIVYASVARGQMGYFVFLYFTAPQPPRG